MRIPHNLTRSLTSGRWSFRQRVPTDLQRVLGCRVIKRTLRTGDLPEAKVRAVWLTAGYARLFTLLRDQRVDKLGKKEADELVARLTASKDLRDLTLHRSRAPDGTVTERWQMDDEKDVQLFRSMQEIYAKDPLLEAVCQVVSAHAPRRRLHGALCQTHCWHDAAAVAVSHCGSW